jgi:tetratricopeptide (TPR) repeat protein
MINLQVERLKRLPLRSGEIWQGGLVRMPVWVTGEGPQPFRPITAMWVSLRTGRINANAETRRPEETDFAMAMDALVEFASNESLAGYRPGKLEVNDPALAEHLSGLLADAGIRVEHCVRLPAIQRCLKELEDHLFGGSMPPGALEGKGITLERMRAYADAAKTFFEASPWLRLSNEDLLEIEAPSLRTDMKFALVLGAGGQEFGLGFYRHMDQYWAMAEAESPDDLPTRELWSLTFDDITEIPPADADLWEDHGLPVPEDGAYPVAVHYENRGRVRRPGADVLAFMEGLMRALAATTEEEMDSGRWTKRVETFDGPSDYTLSLPLLLNPPSHEELYGHGLPSDRRAMERTMDQIHRFLEDKQPGSVDELNALIGKEFDGKPYDVSKSPPRTPLEKAQELCYEAFDAAGRRRIVLAREALKTCPDCADAYVILAEHATNAGAARDLYTQGIEAGRRAIGEETFQKNVGHFWGPQSTRPFMRSLMGLGTTQEQLGDLEGAVTCYRELLRLNPNDNQGVRDLLLPLLITLGRDPAAAELLDQYKNEGTALWTYGAALLAFRREGDNGNSRKWLKKAMKANPHVPEFLLTEEEEDFLPESYSLGSEEEAAWCASLCRKPWRATSGALEWLSATADDAKKPARQPKRRPGKKKD